jgi:hypothetical protein
MTPPPPTKFPFALHARQRRSAPYAMRTEWTATVAQDDFALFRLFGQRQLYARRLLHQVKRFL